MGNQKAKSVDCALLVLPCLPAIPRRTRSKRVLSCRKRLTFDDKCSTPKRKRIPFDVNGRKVAKKLKKIKLEDEFEGSDESKVNSSGGWFNHRKSTEDSQCKRQKQVPILGTAMSGVKDELKVTIKCLPSLHKEVGSSSQQKGNSDGNEKDVLSLWNRRDGRLVQEERFLNKAVDLEPQTPLPAKQKHPSSRKFSAGDKINQLKCGTEDNLQLVVEISSEVWYYTRFVNKCVLDLIRSLECQGASNQPCNHATQHQSLSHKLKVHGVQVSLKGQKKRSKKQSRRSGYAKDALRDWRRLLKKSVAEQPSAKLDEAKGLSLEERALLFVDKVGRIQGSRKQVRWKGSVLDSVIGAFLTQKVSDNFSSSAFMLLGASFPQHHSCDEYGRHHRMLREKRSNARSSPQKPAFGCISKFLDTQGNGWNSEKHTRIPDDGKREKTPRQSKVSRRENPIPDWSSLRMKYSGEGERERRSIDTMDYADWVAVSRANVADISKAISLRGMNHKLAKRIKDFLSCLPLDLGNWDLEWLRNAPPEIAEEFILSIMGLGLKSEECVRLLTLRQPAFPVDVNVARVTVRIGWVPAPSVEDKLLMNLLQEDSKLHDFIREYLWPRLCKLDQETLYQLHYQMITFGKVFCTNKKPNCGECPMRKDCKYYSNIPKRKKSTQSDKKDDSDTVLAVDREKSLYMDNGGDCQLKTSKPSDLEIDVEDLCSVDQHRDVRTLAEVKLASLKMQYQRNHVPKSSEGVYPTHSIEAPETPAKDHPLMKLTPQKKTNKKTVLKRGTIARRSHTRTEHTVYELPDWHPILEKFDDRDPHDSSPYLLVTWEPAEGQFGSSKSEELLVKDTSALSPSCIKWPKTVPGTVMIPCRTALRGNFPLNGTYFQTNEVFADHKTSQTPIDVHCRTLEELPRKTLCCGTDLSRIVKGLSANEIQNLFSEGYICTRGFDRETSTPKPLERQLHISSQGMKEKGMQ